MYQPPHFREDRLDIQHALIRAHPLGLLVTVGTTGLVANPIPFTLDESASPQGTLRAHLSRANPQWRDVDPAQEALVVFQGTETYITPSWYESKRQHGKVVPTWNYAIVQARGPMRIIEDPAWLLTQVTRLTATHEAARPEPWTVGDAPPDFLTAQMKGIVGVEIEIARIEGKWKVSQNRPEADRRGVAAGLRESATDDDRQMAALVEAQGAPASPPPTKWD
ncbi:FMN-binding negative transcriptional regulator [Microvirga pakistanensis]|uniref:FMN-binding negative transcriptional regulator n=1 Tax=Microvirga pakistanensis TaxID=1682650 RepID=UPI00106B10C5|nr:FMN-binding negative transcriptional regulator [Microvirga pakistanensis]